MTKFVKLLIHWQRIFHICQKKFREFQKLLAVANMFVDSNPPPWRSSRSVVRTSDLELGGL